MKNRHNRAQTQCPSCGAWNDSNASMCTGCGRILQVQAKPPVDYRRLMPLILVAVAAFAAVSFWGYLQFTVYDAQRKIANQDYEAAANELMKISFYGKADELLNSPGVGDVEAVIYARAKKQYKAENYNFILISLLLVVWQNVLIQKNVFSYPVNIIPSFMLIIYIISRFLAKIIFHFKIHHDFINLNI